MAQLAANCNVVVDNFSAGVLERFGFGFDVLREINPSIVQAVMPGWGLSGPLKSWVAWGMAASCVQRNHGSLGLS